MHIAIIYSIRKGKIDVIKTTFIGGILTITPTLISIFIIGIILIFFAIDYFTTRTIYTDIYFTKSPITYNENSFRILLIYLILNAYFRYYYMADDECNDYIIDIQDAYEDNYSHDNSSYITCISYTLIFIAFFI